MVMHSQASTKSKLNKRIFIVAGEESGDVHGSHLVSEMLKIDPELSFYGHGGDKMKMAGVEIIEHITKLSLVGFTEVIKHLPYMRTVMNGTIETIKDMKPVRVILIDYPGFNLRLAKKLKNLGVPVTYFILPQVWAWKEKRYKILQRCTDQSISIIPFEKEWFNARNFEIDYVGNPLVDSVKPVGSKKDYFKKHSLKIDQPLLALLPGSRQQEIDQHWPIFSKTIIKLRNIFPNLQFIIGKAPNVIIGDVPKYVKIESDSVKLTMAHGDAGLIASGTASLEATINGLPCVACYKTSGITHWLGKKLSKVNYLSLTNLIAGKKIIAEFIQWDMQPDRLIKAIVPLLSDTPARSRLIEGYDEVINSMGEPGVYQRTARLISKKL